MLEQVLSYKPYNAQEESDRITFLQYLKTFDNLYERENLFGHITCSAWIMNQQYTKVLMVYHSIYRSWGWCGGHCDGNSNLIQVARKEIKEETGLQKVDLVQGSVLSLEVLPVPPHQKHEVFVSAHVHLNVTFLFIANEQEGLHPNLDENSDVKWINIEDISSYVSEKNMLPIYEKLTEKAKVSLNIMHK